MADIARGHNGSAQVGVVPNPDPALDIAHEHKHEHFHHSANAEKGQLPGHDVVYTSGTTADRSVIPSEVHPDDAVHRRKLDEKHAVHDIEKTGGYDSNEGSLERGSNHPRSSDSDIPERRGKYSVYIHLFIAMLFTGWWIASVVVHRKDKNWVVPFLLWLAIMLRLLFFYIPISIVTKPMHFVWNNTGPRLVAFIPERFRLFAGAGVSIAAILLGSFISEESQDNTRANRAVSLFGLLVFLFIFYLTSRNRKKIVWHTVIVGMLMQYIIALFVLRTRVGYDIFAFISELATDLLHMADKGTTFVSAKSVVDLKWWLTSVLPPIIFFIAFVQVLYYWGTVQWFVGKFATFFFWSMRVSGAEAVVAAASPFIGQGESAVLIRPFVAHLTKAEMHQVMTSGFATIAGSVLVAYIGMGINPQALISSCVMSIPASLAISKLRYPEEEETLTSGRVVIPDDDEHRAANTLHAFANGAWLGLKIAGMIFSTILCIIAAIGLIDGLLTWWGRYINLDGEYDLTLELILGYVCYPVAFLLGVKRESNELRLVGQLIGIKVIANEFVAFDTLQAKSNPDSPYHTLSPRSRLIATYAVCGFGNIGSLGTQIGVLSQLAPSRSGDIARLALSALISGVVSTLTSASVAGLVITDQASFS